MPTLPWSPLTGQREANWLLALLSCCNRGLSRAEGLERALRIALAWTLAFGSTQGYVVPAPPLAWMLAFSSTLGHTVPVRPLAWTLASSSIQGHAVPVPPLAWTLAFRSIQGHAVPVPPLVWTQSVLLRQDIRITNARGFYSA